MIKEALELLDKSNYLVNLPVSVQKNINNENIKRGLEEFVNVRCGNCSLHIRHTYKGNIILRENKARYEEYLLHRVQALIKNKIIFYKKNGEVVSLKTGILLNKGGKK